MDALIEQVKEQPPMVLAGAGAVAVLFVVLLVKMLSSSGKKVEAPPTASKSKSKSKKKKAKAKEQPKVEEPPAPKPVEEPSGGGSKKKKKKGAQKQAAEPPKPEPTPPPPEPEPTPEPEPAGKKKKKKKKNKATTEETAATKPAKKEEQLPVTDDEDDSDDEELARLLNKDQLAKTQQAKKKKKKKKKKAPEEEDVPEEEEEAWVTVGGNKAVSQSTSAAATKQDDTPRTIMLNIDAEEKLIILGPKGTTIQGIQQSSGARLDIDMPVIKITGLESQIALAKEEVQTILRNHKEEQRRATAHSTTLRGKQINGAEGVKAIIGKGGASIQAIQSKTGTKVDANVEQGQVVITGPTEQQVAEAATLCKHAVFGESQHVIDLKSVAMVMLIYGKQFQKIRQLQEDSGGAKLDIEKGTTILKISGPTEAVAKAKQMVTAWLEYCKGETLETEASKVGMVYGKSGATIRSIQDRTGAHIEVDDQGKRGKEMAQVNILGEPEAVKQAKELVLKALAGEIELKPGEVMEKMDLTVGAPAVIGRGGSKIRELETRFGVKLVVNSDSGVCRIVGGKDNVEKAKAEIETIIAPLIEEQKIKEEAERLAKEAAETGDAGAWGGNFDDDDAEGW